jgi:hypothetical protein
MNLLSTVGSVAVALQFIQYTNKACHFVKTLCEDNYDGFYEGAFNDLQAHFVHFAAHFKSQRQVGFQPRSSLNQEVGYMQNVCANAHRMAHLMI